MDIFRLISKSSEAEELCLDRGEVCDLQKALGLERKVTELFELLRDPVYRYLTGVLGNSAEAEDLTQEVFLRLYALLQRGQAVGNARAWVFRAAHNLAIDQLRRKHAQHFEETADWEQIADTRPDLASSAEQKVIEREQQQRLRTALARLSPQERYCLDLRTEGLGYREIAEVLGISTSTVATFLSRGIRKITREIHGHP